MDKIARQKCLQLNLQVKIKVLQCKTHIDAHYCHKAFLLIDLPPMTEHN